MPVLHILVDIQCKVVKAGMSVITKRDKHKNILSVKWGNIRDV